MGVNANAEAGRFERLYRESPDPWGYRTSSYERTSTRRPWQPSQSDRKISALRSAARSASSPASSLRAASMSSRSTSRPARSTSRVSDCGECRTSSCCAPASPSRHRWATGTSIVCSEVLYYLRRAGARSGNRLDADTALPWGERTRGELARRRSAMSRSRGDEVHDRLARELAVLARTRRASS